MTAIREPAARTMDEVRARAAAAMDRTFIEAGKASIRDPHSFTGSSIGACPRQGAYKLGGTPVSETLPDVGNRASVLGTWIHEKGLPGYAAQLGPRAECERPTKIRVAGLTLSGTMDIWDPPEVHDWKTCADPGLHGLRRLGGLYSNHRMQFDAYGLGAYQEGHEVRAVVGLYLHRQRGELEVVAEPFTNASVAAVVDRVTMIRHHAATNPDKAPQEGRGPGLSLACDGCSWLRRCWGDDAVPGQVGAQANRVVDDADVEAALLLQDDASGRRSEATKDYNYAKALLGRTRPGIYRSMSLRLGKPGTVVDEAAMVATFEELGLEVPRKPRARRKLIRPEAMLTKKMRAELADYDVTDDEEESD